MKKLSYLFIFLCTGCSDSNSLHFSNNWYRPADNNVFSTHHGNNHDAILFIDEINQYPYHLIVSGWACDPATGSPRTYLWRAREFGWSSQSWELIDSNYKIGCHYEYDDGIKIGDTYYIYEDGLVYTYSGNLEDASGKWQLAGTFPKNLADDIGVFYENGLFHIFGEYGNFEGKPDGTSLSHLTSITGFSNWELLDSLAVDPNKNRTTKTFGVGDPTIMKRGNEYFIFCDIESLTDPYRISAWKSNSLFEQFDSLGNIIEPRSDEDDDWDNHRIQDGDIAFIPSQNRYVMVCNMMDRDGNPGVDAGDFDRLTNFTRVVGIFYSDLTYE